MDFAAVATLQNHGLHQITNCRAHINLVRAKCVGEKNQTTLPNVNKHSRGEGLEYCDHVSGQHCVSAMPRA